MFGDSDALRLGAEDEAAAAAAAAAATAGEVWVSCWTEREEELNDDKGASMMFRVKYTWMHVSFQ